ncbi:hypothetical protein WICMUC_003222 [Wickerhamomyces mucosus]|uniref:ATP-dependent DNA helicase PIF1 n=1 Tax=Wickerhamomyces mucosus TaxID=1378264 RepID=A0A9P8PN42_9ASCO|nr:hypothetical protein WICMUC_003222 [Wickerhamomyces mucosus]
MSQRKREIDKDQILIDLDEPFSDEDSFSQSFSKSLAIDTKNLNDNPIEEPFKIDEVDFESDFSDSPKSSSSKMEIRKPSGQQIQRSQEMKKTKRTSINLDDFFSDEEDLEIMNLLKQQEPPILNTEINNNRSAVRSTGLLPSGNNIVESKSDNGRKVHDSSFNISAPETSSPLYHRTETLFRRNPLNNSQLQLNEKTPAYEKNVLGADISNQPLEQSTQLDMREMLYPKMSDYENRYKVIDVPKSIIDSMPPPKPKFKLDDPSVNKGKRKSKANSELLLMTQKPNLTNSAHSKAKVPGIQNAPKTVQPFSLSEEQQHVAELVLQGSSLFYTGSAGTGKSVLLRSLIKRLKQKYRGEGEVAITASTGLAACNIGGITLHSFSGIGLGNESVENLIKKIKRSKKSANRWRNVKVLIVDEISMIDAELFDKLDEIGCSLRRNDRPFGGIQVICCGDFFQLPPVFKTENRWTTTKQENTFNEKTEATFCFESHSWGRTMKHTIILRQVFRQKGDLEFIDMLNDMRLGKVSSHSLEKFRELERPLPKDDIEPAELYSTRSEVERANNQRLKNLKSQLEVYNSNDGGTLVDLDVRERLLANFIAPQRLELKKGAQVMMLKNLDESLVNGSLGKVIDFIDKDTYLTYQKLEENPNLDNYKIEAAIENNLARARDVNKKESPDLLDENYHHEELEDTIFGFLNEINTTDAEVLKDIQSKKELMNKLNSSSMGSKLPLVRFLTPDGQSRCVLVSPETWSVEDERQQPLVTRTQLPLMLAWALSIHKSQGQTLPKVRVNLKRVFEKGQAYVAISRAVSRDGLQVLNFDPNKVFAHPKVIEFYNNLQTTADILNESKPPAMLESQDAIAEEATDEDEFFDASYQIPVNAGRDVHSIRVSGEHDSLALQSFNHDTSEEIKLNKRRRVLKKPTNFGSSDSDLSYAEPVSRIYMNDTSNVR